MGGQAHPASLEAQAVPINKGICELKEKETQARSYQ
jgi:hypothetical protein